MIVVTDTSVILHLCMLGLEELLPRFFGAVLAPPEVRREFEHLVTRDSRFSGLAFPPFIEVIAPSHIPAVLTGLRLDPGELAALALAVEHGNAAVLIDEKDGRAAARALGLTLFGLLGILAKGREQNLIGSLAPLFDRLQQARFWIHPVLRERILQRVGELP